MCARGDTIQVDTSNGRFELSEVTNCGGGFGRDDETKKGPTAIGPFFVLALYQR
jgi:hypothetical protein